MTRAQIQTQIIVAQAREAFSTQGSEVGAVHKWTLLRTLSEIRCGLAVSDRALGVLSALLSFHPETALTLAPTHEGRQDELTGARRNERGASSADLVVFPSNKALSLRCNGMSEATLRRHLSALVEAGLIIRRDSPNGKRFARRELDEEGSSQAFGFDLSPLVARAGEFDGRLERLRAEQRRERLLKERVNLLRRDLTKRLAFALDEELPGPWERLRQAFLGLCTPLRKLRGLSEVAALSSALERLLCEVSHALEAAVATDPTGTPDQDKNENSSGDAAQFERRITDSNTKQFFSFEPTSEEAGAGRGPDEQTTEPATPELPLKVVLDVCRDVAIYDFSDKGISTWRDFIGLAAAIRPMLGVSPTAWAEAVAALGEKNAATAIGFILQRCEHSSEAHRLVTADGRVQITVNGSPAIRSPGGYLRALTDKGRRDGFGLWPALLAHLAQRAKSASRP